MKQKKISSKSEAGAEWGPPASLPGCVEITWLTEETADTELWKHCLKSHYATKRDVILLANLHGDCLEYPEILGYLQKITSAFLVFFMPDKEEVHQQKYIQLESLMESLSAEKRLIDVFVDPTYDEPQFVNTKSLDDHPTINYLHKKIAEAINLSPIENGVER